MRQGILGSVGVLLSGAGLALAQAPGVPPRHPPPTPAAAATPVPADTGPVADCAATADGRFADGPPLPAPGHLYLDADYLLWFTRPTKLPPLLIAGPQGSGFAPALGQPNTTVLIGDKQVDAGTRSGARVRLGGWLDSEATFGVEASGFLLEQIGSTFSVTSGAQTLGLPFLELSNPLTSAPPLSENSLLIAAPTIASSATVVHTSTHFWGAELDSLCHVRDGSWYRADAIFGFRYLHLDEDLDISSTSTAVPVTGSVPFQGNPVAAPATLGVTDSFRTRNDFYGGQVGAHVLAQSGMWYADFRTTVAAGVTCQHLSIDGATSLTSGGVTTTVPGGVYSQLSNIGGHSKTQFTLVPEGSVTFGCQITSYLRAYVGYSAVYWSEGVLRPATELDRVVSSTALPAQNPTSEGIRPTPLLRRQDFWGQGAHFGVEVDF